MFHPQEKGGLSQNSVVLHALSLVLLLVSFFLLGLPKQGYSADNDRDANYPISTKVVESAARLIIAELEKKAEYRYLPGERGDYYASGDSAKKRPYLKVPWNAGEKEPVAVYLFQERGTKQRPPFSELLEKELSLALAGSGKFIPVTRDERFLAMHKKELAPGIDEKTAPAFGRALGARYFLTGLFWPEGGSTVVVCSLWDAELGIEMNVQRIISRWDPILLKERALSGWWKALVALVALIALALLMRLLNRSVCYNLRCRENKAAYIALQVVFGLVTAGLVGLAGLWWLGS